MEIIMKKKILSVIASILAFSMVAACTDKPASVSNSTTTEASVSSSVSTEVSASADTKKDTETSVSVSTEQEPEGDPRFTSDKAKADLDVIKSFLEGTGKANVEKFAEFVDGEQTMEQLLLSHGSLIEFYTDASFLPSKVSSYIADCGQDGEPELFLNVDYTQPKENGMTVKQTLIFKPVGDMLNFTSYISDAYRGSTTINRYGLVEESGSNSASDHAYNISYVDAEGSLIRALTSETMYGISECTVPSYFLDVSMDDIISDTLEYSGNIAVTAYSFGRIDTGMEQYDTETSYADYVRSRKYAFSRNGESIMPELDYVEKCAKQGVNIVSYKEYDKEVDDYMTDLGFPAEKRMMDDVEWDPIEFATDFDAVKAQYADFESFVTEEKKVTVEGPAIVPEGEYSYAGLATAISDVIKEWNMPSDWSDGEYAFIDCGLDGNPELVLRYFYGDWSTDVEQVQYYILIKNDNGKLVVFDILEDAYRHSVSIDKQGGVTDSGSNGAASEYLCYSVYDKDHNKQFVYEMYEYFNLGKTEIPDDCLPTGIYQDIQQDEYVWGGEYTLRTYTFDKAPDYTEDISFEEHYGNIAKSRYYLFYKDDSNVGADYDYSERCREKGINIVSYDLIEDLFKKKFGEMHISNYLYYSFLWWNSLPMG